MTPRLRILAAAALLAWPLTQHAAQAQGRFGDLLNRLPDNANTVVLINAEEVFGSEVAVREGWRKGYERNYANAPLMLPPEAQQFALAAELDLGDLTPRWETATMRIGAAIPIATITRLVGGQPDTIGGFDAALTPNGAYIVRLAEQEYGVMRARDRQAVARWLRTQSAGRPQPLTPYLSESAAFADRGGAEIVMAIDLADALSPRAIRKALAGSEVIAANSVDVGAAADELATLRGVTLGVAVTDKPNGSLKVDFAGPIPTVARVAKPLLIEVLEQAGIAIDEFYDWRVETSASGFRISGVFTRSGLTRVFSLLEVDASTVKGDAPAGEESPNEANPYDASVSSTKDYFDAVEKYLNDLGRETGAKSYYSIATWFEKYAKRIDRLPILGVDKDLVDFGAYTVSQLRDCSEAIRGAGINSGARSAAVTSGGYNSGYGAYGYENSLFYGGAYGSQVDGVRAVEADRIAIRKQERAKSSTTVRGIVRELKEQTSKIRRGLTERYQIEF